MFRDGERASNDTVFPHVKVKQILSVSQCEIIHSGARMTVLFEVEGRCPVIRSDRRGFIKQLGCLAAAGGGGTLAASAQASAAPQGAPADAWGVLVDLSECIGCRRCEHACRKANGGDPGPIEAYDDQSVFKAHRRPTPDQFTVVNAFVTKGSDNPVYAKVNCLHCNHPACASACIVGALKKQENGAVTYNSSICIGCRYCMVACPFQIPTYQYDDPITPRVRKCEFCFAERSSKGQAPACQEVCPRNVMKFGKRSELLEQAHARLRQHPDRYIDHIYGEHEVGGTSWLYLSPVDFNQVGFLDVPQSAPPALTETIQHAVFSPKLGVPPLILYGVLGATMFVTGRRHRLAEARSHKPTAMESVPVTRLEHHSGPRVTEEGGGVAVLDPPVALLEASPPGEEHHHDDAHHHEEPAPVDRKLLTPGVWVLIALVVTGLYFAAKRFIFGLQSTTNLDQQYPWGLWIGIDVASGVALAAGGFTSAFLAHVLHRERYHAIVRPALLTAALGYTFVVIGLQADLGRYWNVWRPMFNWQGNSVLFEVGMCVMCYLNVLYLEFAPIVCERLMKQSHFPRIKRLASLMQRQVERIMFLLIIAGCVLSCLHQSSLGNLMVIAPTKLHPLWWTPISALLFLLSAFAVGFPMVIWESLFASWSLKLKPEMNVLAPLARFIPFTLGLYAAFKIGDVIHRGAYTYLDDWSLQSICWMVEIGAGALLPLLLLSIGAVRRSPRLLFVAVTLIVVGIIFNRVNVFLIGYKPPFAQKAYVPSIGEFAVTIGLISLLMLCYRVTVTYLPVISQHKPRATH